MNRPVNPFITSGYHSPAFFCDRKEETRLLLSQIKNSNNTTLFALRRLGKTGLIHHVFYQLSGSKKYACIYTDILNTSDLKGFTNSLATAIYNRFPEKKGIGQRFLSLLKLLRPVISYDTMTGNPEVTLDLGMPREFERTIQQLFSFLDKQNIQVVIAIDEFQQITAYPEKNTEALLRTYMQQLKNCRFIFCGSNHRIMTEMFNNAKRPFYASCNNVPIGFIDKMEYARFIKDQLALYRRKADDEAVEHILQFTCNHTFYVQNLCNHIFARGAKLITMDEVLKACSEVLQIWENSFYQYRSLLTKAQWELLTAIAREEKLLKPYATEFIRKHQLGNSSLVKRGLEALITKEMVYYDTSIKEPYYAVYDKFLMRWLQ
jgi:AAA+ ATPase superfamily predicted ATPase